jgi:putative ABC transport system permease protein
VLNAAPLDGRVLAFAAAVSLLTGIAIGLLPAITSSRGDLHSDLREGSGATSARGRARNALVVAQSALAVLLLIGAALLVQSFRRELQQNPGFVVEHALMLRLQLPARKYPDAQKRAEFARALTEQIASKPGVRAVGITGGMPMGNHQSTGDFSVVGRLQLAEKDLPYAEKRLVSSGYFAAMQIPLLRGRLFTDREPTRVVVVNETLAKRIFPNQDPLGQKIDGGMFPTAVVNRPDTPTGAVVPPSDTDAEIIGVVADVKQHDLARVTSMEIDYPYDQIGWAYLEVVVRSTGEPMALTAAMKAAVANVDPELPIAKIRTVEDLIDASVGAQKLSAQLLGGFSLAALLLAALGIYGVVSYGVARREREIGVRMALGAAREDVLGMILREGLKLTLLGVLCGAVAALIVTRFLSGFLFGISPSDPLTYLGVAGVLALVATLASFLPARRATRVDPASALRSE